MLEGIEVLCHSSIRMNRGKVIYIDPYKIEQNSSKSTGKKKEQPI